MSIRFSTSIRIAVCLALILPGVCLAAGKPLMMATTTSTDNTGLLDYLIPEFTKATGVELRWVATGTGKALRLGQNCDADILMVHAPPAEKKFVDAGFGKDRTEVMYNDFVIVGPVADPAALRGLSVTRTMQTIQKRSAVFVSRGDNSGTNKKEKSLWKAAGMTLPEKETWYVQTGQGMLATLNVAAERNGYTMTDRGTYIKYEANLKGNPPLVILVEGDPVLLNQYSVIAIDPAHCSNAQYEKANAFIDWVTASRAQKEIGKFRLLGKQLFTPNAR